MNEEKLNPSLAGKKSGEARRLKAQQRKMLKEICEDAAYARAPVPPEKAKQIGKLLGKPASKVTVSDAAIYQQAMNAVRGDIASLCFMRDMLGEKPVEHMQGTLNLKTDFEIIVEPEEETEPETETDDAEHND